MSRSHGLKNQWFESNLNKITRPVAAIKSLRFALLVIICEGNNPAHCIINIVNTVKYLYHYYYYPDLCCHIASLGVSWLWLLMTWLHISNGTRASAVNVMSWPNSILDHPSVVQMFINILNKLFMRIFSDYTPWASLYQVVRCLIIGSLKICVLQKSYFLWEFQTETLYVCFGHAYKVSAWNSHHKCDFWHCIFLQDYFGELENC